MVRPAHSVQPSSSEGESSMNRSVSGFVWSVLLLIVVTTALPSFGQVQNASLTGLVTDPTGAVIPGATVSLKNAGTNAVYTQETDESGYYLFPSLSIGAYTIMVEMPGFKRSVQDGVVLQVSQRGRNDVRLEVGGASEEVQV